MRYFESSHHIEDTARCARYNLNTIVQPSDIFSNTLTTNTSMTLHVHEVSNGQKDLLCLLCQLSKSGVNGMIVAKYAHKLQNDLVGEIVKAWVSLDVVSKHCKTPIENTAVFPVPD